MHRWNSRRVALPGALAVVSLVVVGTALAAGGKAPTHATVAINGVESIKTNAYYQATFHFAPGSTTIKSGGTITLTNNGPDPHTLSLVKASQVPHTLKQMENCAACAAIGKSHGLSEGGPQIGPPPILLVNVGAAGFDAPGDSIVIAPKGRGGPVKFHVTARPGTVLNFICIIHPWMSGRFLVK